MFLSVRARRHYLLLFAPAKWHTLFNVVPLFRPYHCPPSHPRLSHSFKALALSKHYYISLSLLFLVFLFPLVSFASPFSLFLLSCTLYSSSLALRCPYLALVTLPTIAPHHHSLTLTDGTTLHHPSRFVTPKCHSGTFGTLLHQPQPASRPAPATHHITILVIPLETISPPLSPPSSLSDIPAASVPCFNPIPRPP
ncbi:hypothetical protein E2C01_066744 [Portunus trituberculatus]|uniref:Uncharacterized protein n=1 Tax=Portunus trituberculatus TaxID=210409 RepID=A0A5B7HRQ2_PORTR|nr:hypothetical protein [Portunus trituberculatus]